MSTNIPDLSRLKVGAVQMQKNMPDESASAPIQNIQSVPSLYENIDDISLPPLPPPKSPELIQREQELRIIISLYQTKFPQELSILGPELDPMAMNLMDHTQLESLRDKCDRLLGGSSGCESKKKAFNACLYVIERIGCMSGVHCEGLTGLLLNDSDYQRDVTRLALRYLSASDCKPEVSIGLKIISTAVQLHANNEIKQREKAIEQQFSAQEASKKISDIDKKFDNIA